jgi:hypothetical protein
VATHIPSYRALVSIPPLALALLSIHHLGLNHSPACVLPPHSGRTYHRLSPTHLLRVRPPEETGSVWCREGTLDGWVVHSLRHSYSFTFAVPPPPPHRCRRNAHCAWSRLGWTMPGSFRVFVATRCQHLFAVYFFSHCLFLFRFTTTTSHSRQRPSHQITDPPPPRTLRSCPARLGRFVGSAGTESKTTKVGCARRVGGRTRRSRLSTAR